MTASPFHPATLSCPRCKAPLAPAGDDLSCAGCTLRYPVLGTLPVLVRNPAQYLVHEAVRAERFCQGLESLAACYRELAGKNNYRSAVSARVAHALDENLALARAQQAPLLARASVAGLVQYAANPPPAELNTSQDAYGFSALDQNLGYARVDWCHTAEGEAQVRAVQDVVFAQVDRHCAARQSVTVLGAGTGRYLYDLVDRFEQAIGIDFCYRYVDFFHRLRSGPVSFWHVNTRMPVSDETIVQRCTASLPQGAPSRLGRIAYPIGDATALPLADSSQSAIVSIFFSDVIPLHLVMQEAARVLKPGGKFICYGPLTYMFNDPQGHLSPGQARHVLWAFGFHIDEESMLELPFQAFPDGGLTRVFRIWSYVATRDV